MRNSNNTSTTTRPSACGSTTKSEVQAPVGLARAMQQQKSDHFVGSKYPSRYCVMHYANANIAYVYATYTYFLFVRASQLVLVTTQGER